MEFLLQYLDELDDFIGALALVAERLRRLLKALILMSVTFALLLFGVMLALTQPPLALAVISLLAVGMLYRAVVNHAVKALPVS
ncbi:MAG TPA: hypothetical protein VNQ14_02935 [Woeseiaceae bacterium]|nr:hypothetical protein [Woeseiaceae bacterium]